MALSFNYYQLFEVLLYFCLSERIECGSPFGYSPWLIFLPFWPLFSVFHALNAPNLFYLGTLIYLKQVVELLFYGVLGRFHSDTDSEVVRPKKMNVKFWSNQKKNDFAEIHTFIQGPSGNLMIYIYIYIYIYRRNKFKTRRRRMEFWSHWLVCY